MPRNKRFKLPPAHSDAHSPPASNVAVHSRPQIGSMSPLSAPTQIGASSLPYTHTTSSHQEVDTDDLQDDIGSFDINIDDLLAPSGDITSSGSKKKSYWVVNVVGKKFFLLHEFIKLFFILFFPISFLKLAT